MQTCTMGNLNLKKRVVPVYTGKKELGKRNSSTMWMLGISKYIPVQLTMLYANMLSPFLFIYEYPIPEVD